MQAASPSLRRSQHSADRENTRTRKRSPSFESERKRHRSNRRSSEPIPRSKLQSERSWDREAYENFRRISSQHIPNKRTPSQSNPYTASPKAHAPSRGYENGFGSASMPSASGMYSRSAAPMHPAVAQQTSKSRRLYIGNVPYHAGLTDVALTQFFSALYVAGFRANKPGEPLPVISFWLHSDGKFGFMELRGEQEAVNMMQFNGIFLHGRPLRVNRPSDYRPEVHNPSALNLVPEMVNVEAVMELCEKLGGVTAAPTQLISLAATKPLTSTMPNSPNKEPSVPMETTEKKGPISSETKAPTPCSDSQLDKDIKVESESQASSQEKGKEDVTKAGVETVDAVVVSLQNLITDADVEGNDEEYEDIVADVRAECESYSKVESVSIPRTGIWKGCAFVEFKDSVGAKKAMKSLSTRVFDGRQILAIAVEGCKTAAEAAARPGGK